MSERLLLSQPETGQASRELESEAILTAIWEGNLHNGLLAAVTLEDFVELLSPSVIDEYCQTKLFDLGDRSLLHGAVNNVKVLKALEVLAGLPVVERTRQNLMRMTDLSRSTVLKYCKENGAQLTSAQDIERLENDFKIKQALADLPAKERTMHNLIEATGLSWPRIYKYCQANKVEIINPQAVQREKNGLKIQAALAALPELERTMKNLKQATGLKYYQIKAFCLKNDIPIVNPKKALKAKNDAQISEALMTLTGAANVLDELVQRTGLGESRIKQYCQENNISLANSQKVKRAQRELKIKAALKNIAADQRTRVWLQEATGLSAYFIRKYCQENNISLANSQKVKRAQRDLKIKATLEDLAADQRTMRQLRQATGLSAYVIRQYCQKHNISLVTQQAIQKAQRDLKIKATLEDLAADQRTMGQLRQATGLSIYAIRQYCQKHNISLFTRQEIQKAKDDLKIKAALDSLAREIRTLGNLMRDTGLSRFKIHRYCQAESITLANTRVAQKFQNNLKIQRALEALPANQRTVANIRQATGLGWDKINKYCQAEGITLIHAQVAQKLQNDLKIQRALVSLPAEIKTKVNLALLTGLSQSRVYKYCREHKVDLSTAKGITSDGRTLEDIIRDSNLDLLELNGLPAKYQAAILDILVARPDFKFNLDSLSADYLEAIEALLVDISPFKISKYIRTNFDLSSHQIHQYLLVLGLDLDNHYSMVRVHNNQIIAKAAQAVPLQERTIYNLAQSLTGFYSS